MNDSSTSFDHAAYDADVAAAEALALTLTVAQQDVLAECASLVASEKAITAKRVGSYAGLDRTYTGRKAECRARALLAQLVRKGLLAKRVDGTGYHAKAEYTYDNSSEARYGWSVVWHCAKACRSLWADRYRETHPRTPAEQAEADEIDALVKRAKAAKAAKATTTSLCRRCHVPCDEGHDHCDPCHEDQLAEHAEQCGGLPVDGEHYRLSATVGDEPVREFAGYLTVPTLKGWLRLNRLSTGGLKADLVARVVAARAQQEAPKPAPALRCNRCHKAVCGAATMDRACCEWYGSSRCCGLGVQQEPECCDGYTDSCKKAIGWVLVQRENEAEKCRPCLALRQAEAERRGL